MYWVWLGAPLHPRPAERLSEVPARTRTRVSSTLALSNLPPHLDVLHGANMIASAALATGEILLQAFFFSLYLLSNLRWSLNRDG